MKRILLTLTLLIVATIGIALPGRSGAQSASPNPTPSPSPSPETFETVKEYLLTSAATDFHEHQPPFPAKFRNVRIGHVGDVKKEVSYRLCGEFLPSDGGDKAEWIGFVTIKTSEYEQFIGSGTTYCTDPKLTWDTTNDLAPTLKDRLDSIKK